MASEKEFTILSSDQRTRLHVVLWEPDKEVRRLLVISHGMAEHIMRYRPFALNLAGHGFAVIGHDHLGHGKTVQDGRFGYFSDEKGNVRVIKDMHKVAGWLRHRHPDLPLFMMGHSMGSFFLRKYITVYGEGLSGAIIMGTGDQPLFMVAAGKLFSQCLGLVFGKEHRSALLQRLVLGRCNRSFRHSRTESDWLTRCADSVDAFCSDPLCGFLFTCSAYTDFFSILLDLKLHRQEALIPRALPLLLVSGKDDPVGDEGRGVERSFKHYKQIGMTDIKMTLYPGDRHEILNELDKDKVWGDLLRWLESK